MAQDQVSCKFLHQGAISRSAALSSYNWDAFAPGSWGFGTRGANPVIVLFASQFNACAPFDALEQTAQPLFSVSHKRLFRLSNSRFWHRLCPTAVM
jgi:hypothetical protein